VEAYKRRTGQRTEMVLNEFIPFVGDWCNPDDPHFGKDISAGYTCDVGRLPGWPGWQDPATARGDPDLRHGAGLGINRR
jgi:hypothetical protein